MAETQSKISHDMSSVRGHNRVRVQQVRRRRRLIRFADEIVSETILIPKIPDEDLPSFFYSISELEETLEAYRSNNYDE